jgi:DNA-binding NarL/FixJ family response regulator
LLAQGSDVRLNERRERRIVMHVLIVESHALFRDALALLLKWRMGFESIYAGSLAETQSVLYGRLAEADLVIVDLNLLEEDGISLIENIREVESDVPVLALTGGRRLEQRARAWEVGADEVLSTAADTEKIIRAVERCNARLARKR